MIIRQATKDDMQGIMDLLRKYHINTIAPEDKEDGFVTTNISNAQLEALIEEEQGVTVAVMDDNIVCFAFAAPWAYWKQWPMMNHMSNILCNYSLEGIPLTKDNTYQYGPICIDKSARGMGTFEKVFYASLEKNAEKFPVMITFVNKINPKSYYVHTKKGGMTTLDTFEYNNNTYYLMATFTKTP